MMKLTTKDPTQASGDLLVFFVEEKDDKKCTCPDANVEKMMRAACRAGDFAGKEDEVLLLYPPKSGAAQVNARRILFVGCGRSGEDEPNGKDDPNLRREQLHKASGTAASQGRRLKAGRVIVVLPDFTGLAPDAVAESVAEGLVLGNYLFSKYKKPEKKEDMPVQVGEFILACGAMPASSVRKGMARGVLAGQATCVARDMANEPGNFWTPVQFAEFGRNLADRSSLKCTILEKAWMKKQGMGGILAVNQGSALPPKLVVLEYRTTKTNPTLMLVGKGLTFDSGGISLKPAAGMEDMKYDMCGGAAVLAAMEAVAEEKPKGINIIALVPATDNMSGSAAVKPGDVITHYNGKTCEVVNTDAEGRLILADALAYGIKRFKPDAVVDIATLTGAVIIGLGHHRTGLLSNNDDLAEQILAAGDKCAEPLWRLPLGTEYAKQLNSEVADLKNVGGREAGTITAACFLQEFVGKTPWAHLDIAGTAWGFTKKPYMPAKGPSGIGARTLLTLIRDWRVPAAKL